MMLESVSPPVRRLAALGLLLALCMAISSLVLIPLITEWTSNRNLIALERERLTQLKAKLAKAVATSPAELASRRQSVLDVQVTGRTESQQLAALQEKLRSLAQKSDLRIQSLRAIPSFERNGIRLIGAQLSITTSLQKAQRLIWELESARPIILIDGLELSPASPRTAQAAGDAEVYLNVRLAAPVASTEIAIKLQPEEVSR